MISYSELVMQHKRYTNITSDIIFFFVVVVIIIIIIIIMSCEVLGAVPLLYPSR
jgi:hypothetical protein